MLKGIDISNHNYKYLKDREWYDLLSAEFVIMKASEGLTYKDPCLDEYYDRLHGKKDGKPDKEKLYGFYHYARPENMNNPIREAQHFLSLVGHHAGSAVFALDVEGDALKMSDFYLNAWVSTWCAAVIQATCVKPIVYCSASITNKFKGAADIGCGLWVASWGKKPTKKSISPWTVYALWQSGVDHLDRDVFNGSAEQFRKYCKKL